LQSRRGTDWGKLDVLLLDMPPGTGDVQLQLCQDVQLDGAVAVTTPSNVAIADVLKGIEMFNSLGVPTLSVVENMAYFECEGGGRHYPFGKGGEKTSKRIGEVFGIDKSLFFEMPISSLINQSNDEGTPIMLSNSYQGQLEVEIYDTFASSVSQALFIERYNRTSNAQGNLNIGEKDCSIDSSNLSIKINSSSQGFTIRMFLGHSAEQINIDGKQLRARDPQSGKINQETLAEFRKEEEKENERIVITQTRNSINTILEEKWIPKSISRKGNYGFIVEWNDGAKIIYSVSCIASAIQDSISKH